MILNDYIHILIIRVFPRAFRGKQTLSATDFSVQTRTTFDETVSDWTCMNNNPFIFFTVIYHKMLQNHTFNILKNVTVEIMNTAIIL